LPQLQKLAFLGCHFPDDDDGHTEPEDEADGGEILREADVDEILRSAAEPISKRRDILPGAQSCNHFALFQEGGVTCLAQGTPRGISCRSES
jgi:hypothetical protein